MTITYFFITLNHHEVNVVDELYKIIGQGLTFVEICNLSKTGNKGCTEDFSTRPYLLQAWRSKENHKKALELAISSDVALFVGYQSLTYQITRMKTDKFSFDVSERWLKKGLSSVFSPRLFTVLLNYHLRGWHNKPLYKLCSSAYAASDHGLLGMYKGKCYKWGYFTKVDNIVTHESSFLSNKGQQPSLMWCARYLKWKHPELPIMMAARLKQQGYHFVLDMYGSGKYEGQAKLLAADLGVNDIVHFIGSKPNNELRQDMRRHDIFLFTSDRNEGWGAVANESMSNGCVLVASDAIGSAPYLVKPGVTGVLFHAPRCSSSLDNPDLTSLDSLCEKVKFLLDNPADIHNISQKAIIQMQDLWSPEVAARRLLTLINCLQRGKNTVFDDGPCSKA